MEDEDRDRQLSELLAELRVILPSVTVLVAFLLTVPSSAGFDRLSTGQRIAYFVAFLTTVLAMVLLVGETAYHRMRGRPYDKGQLIRTASRQAVAAIALLAVALSAVAFLVTDALYPWPVAVAVAVALMSTSAATWFMVPLRRRASPDS